MTSRRPTAPQLDVEKLPSEVRAAIEDVLAGDALVLTRWRMPFSTSA
jgi:hypothetical protein